MTLPRYVPLVLAGLLVWTACDDPSNVGIGLVEDQGDPEVETAPSAFIEAFSQPDVTGAAQRILTGQVSDPLLGELRATAYLDVQSVFDTTGNPTITAVSLRLVRDYVYGDTTSVVSLNLYDLIEDWSAAGAKADTTLPLGSLATTFDLAATDSVVLVPMPEAWVAANDTTLRSNAFATIFHGFAIEPADGNAVVGFDAARSVLRVETDQDTLDYPLLRTLSGIQGTNAPPLPEHRLLVQDGLGASVKFDFVFDEEAHKDLPVHGVTVRLFADTAAVSETPPHFVRPLQRRLQIVAAQEDDLPFLLGTATLTEEGQYLFREAPSGNVLSLRDIVQRLYLGSSLYEYFEIRTPGTDNTINAMLLYDASDPTTAPEALVTLTRITP